MDRSSIENTPNSADKSWIEMCDEYYSNSSADENEAESNDKAKTDLKDNVNVNTKTSTVKEVNQKCDVNCQDENKPKVSTDCTLKTSKTDREEVKIEKEESPWRFSYATILKNSASKTNIDETKQTPTKQTQMKQIKTEIVESTENSTTNRGVKREIQREFLQEDLSLTSHLDVFHMQSPMKLEPADEEMGSPMKADRETRLSKKRLCAPKLSLCEDAVMSDDILMPSPKKVTRLSTRRKRESGESPLTCKRSKNSSGYRNTPRCVVPVEPPTIELETDEQVLLRRQKQIDYGKNTIGYERYLQMVPKLKRHKKHPQTPPKHIKYSRRAWDGLIKQWRQQLHFWDPPSQGGGNIDDLDLSSMSEASSDAGSQASSQPATPCDKSRTRRATRSSRSSECSSIAEDSGCSPLKDI